MADQERWRPTVAVSALIWRGNEVLFLHRAHPPLIWVPPGGRVEAGEEPYAALHREMKEETSLESVEVIAPYIVVAGRHEGREILYVDFVCRYRVGEVVLDPREHDDWRWLDLDHLTRADSECLTAPGGDPYYIYHWHDAELQCSHSLEQLRQGRLILRCLEDGDSRLAASSNERR